MGIELNGNDHGKAHDEAPLALVGQRRRTTGHMAGAVSARLASPDAEERINAALRRVLAAMVAKRLQGYEKEGAL